MSGWLSQVTFICHTSPRWFSPLCLGLSPSSSSHPPPFYLSIYPSILPSGWPSGCSDFLPGSDLTVPGCRWVKWWEMEEEGMWGSWRDVRTRWPMLLHVNFVHATALYSTHNICKLQATRHKQGVAEGNQLINPAVLGLDGLQRWAAIVCLLNTAAVA